MDAQLAFAYLFEITPTKTRLNRTGLEVFTGTTATQLTARAAQLLRNNNKGIELKGAQIRLVTNRFNNSARRGRCFVQSCQLSFAHEPSPTSSTTTTPATTTAVGGSGGGFPPGRSRQKQQQQQATKYTPYIYTRFSPPPLPPPPTTPNKKPVTDCVSTESHKMFAILWCMKYPRGDEVVFEFSLMVLDTPSMYRARTMFTNALTLTRKQKPVGAVAQQRLWWYAKCNSQDGVVWVKPHPNPQYCAMSSKSAVISVNRMKGMKACLINDIEAVIVDLPTHHDLKEFVQITLDEVNKIDLEKVAYVPDQADAEGAGDDEDEVADEVADKVVEVVDQEYNEEQQQLNDDEQQVFLEQEAELQKELASLEEDNQRLVEENQRLIEVNQRLAESIQKKEIDCTERVNRVASSTQDVVAVKERHEVEMQTMRGIVLRLENDILSLQKAQEEVASDKEEVAKLRLALVTLNTECKARQDTLQKTVNEFNINIANLHEALKKEQDEKISAREEAYRYFQYVTLYNNALKQVEELKALNANRRQLQNAQAEVDKCDPAQILPKVRGSKQNDTFIQDLQHGDYQILKPNDDNTFRVEPLSAMLARFEKVTPQNAKMIVMSKARDPVPHGVEKDATMFIGSDVDRASWKKVGSSYFINIRLFTGRALGRITPLLMCYDDIHRFTVDIERQLLLAPCALGAWDLASVRVLSFPTVLLTPRNVEEEAKNQFMFHLRIVAQGTCRLHKLLGKEFMSLAETDGAQEDAHPIVYLTWPRPSPWVVTFFGVPTPKAKIVPLYKDAVRLINENHGSVGAAIQLQANKAKNNVVELGSWIMRMHDMFAYAEALDTLIQNSELLLTNQEINTLKKKRDAALQGNVNQSLNDAL